MRGYEFYISNGAEGALTTKDGKAIVFESKEDAVKFVDEYRSYFDLYYTNIKAITREFKSFCFYDKNKDYSQEV